MAMDFGREETLGISFGSVMTRGGTKNGDHDPQMSVLVLWYKVRLPAPRG